MKPHNAFLLGILIIIDVSTITNELNYLTTERDVVYPYIVEYIDNFTITANDIHKLLQNQFRRITISDINTTAYQLHNNTITLSYLGSSKQVQKISPLKVKVTHDSFQLEDSFNIRVLHAIGGKNYSCQTKIPQIYIDYVKEVDFASGNILITNLTSTYSSKSFKEATCKQTIADKDKSKIADAINSTKTASLYLQLKKMLDKIQYYMQINAKGDHLSNIYDQNPYSYDFYGFKIAINVSTIEANSFEESGIQNCISGVISDATHPAVEPPAYEEGFTTFISLQFIQNFIEYTKNSYAGWRGVRLNRNNMRTNVFKFRLVDFESIVPAVLKKYPQRYLADVEIQCAAEELRTLTLDEQHLTQDINWRCLGNFQDNKVKIVFIDFLIGLRHTAEILVQPNSLGVRVNSVELIGLSFDYVDALEIIDPFAAAEYIKLLLFEFRVFTPGTYFKVNSPKQIKKQIASQGIWIG